MVHIPGLGDIPDEMNDAEFAAKVGGKACLKISDFLKLIGDDDDDAPNGTDHPAVLGLGASDGSAVRREEHVR